jgi:hypothetical protein
MDEMEFFQMDMFSDWLSTILGWGMINVSEFRKLIYHFYRHFILTLPHIPFTITYNIDTN